MSKSCVSPYQDTSVNILLTHAKNIKILFSSSRILNIRANDTCTNLQLSQMYRDDMDTNNIAYDFI